MKKFFAAVALGVTAIGTLSPVQAAQLNQEHQELWDTLEGVGISVHVNEPDVCEDNWGGGMYIQHEGDGYLIVCQDKGENAGTDNQVQWSANDYDTLRHEAHHVIQDCKAGDIADGELEPVLDDVRQHERFVRSSLSQRRIKWIIENYVAKGADRDTIILELEAFSVAQGVSATQITRGLDKLCAASFTWNF